MGGQTEETAKQNYKKFVYSNGELIECEAFYNDKGEMEYKKASLDKAVALDMIANRRQGKKEKEYECKWVGYSIDFLTWVSRPQLIEMGYKVNVQREDEKQAAMEGLQTKQLTTPGVEGHLEKFGVAPEFATHNHLRSLSAGLKVKVVLAAAMWQNPHILVIDEPTNYLDRDALGALTEAIEKWNGGVVVISHNLEFCNRVATEKWIMDAGHLRAEGGEYTDTKLDQSNKLDEIQDASGNTIKVKNLKTLTAAEAKKEIKLLEKKLKDAKKNGTLSEDETYEVEDRLVQLKAQLEAK